MENYLFSLNSTFENRRILLLAVCLLSIIIIKQGIASSSEVRGFDIVGVGNDSPSAVSDGLRQIQEIFGRCSFNSESLVKDFILEKDIIEKSVKFSGSKLDRFYQGVFMANNRYYALFRFPPEFVKSVLSAKRDTSKKHFTATFDKFEYDYEMADSFGENTGFSWSVKIPKFIRRFFDYLIWHVDAIGSFEISESKN